jgi:hypothetical protein
MFVDVRLNWYLLIAGIAFMAVLAAAAAVKTLAVLK